MVQLHHSNGIYSNYMKYKRLDIADEEHFGYILTREQLYENKILI